MNILNFLRNQIYLATEGNAYIPRGTIMERIDAQKARGRRSAIFMEADISPKDARFFRSQGYRVTREYLVNIPSFEIFW